MTSGSPEFDYVVVGAGAAGCVLAARLSEDPDVRVCLLEAGGDDRSVLVRCPAGFALTLPTAIRNWAYATVPQPGLNGRRGYQPMGRMIGGSTSMNAMIYMRGTPEDYDDWARAGCGGWGWGDLLPVFKASEHREAGGSELRGTGGPLNVASLRSPNPVGDAFLDAAEAIGIPRTDDFNGPMREGAGRFEVMQIDGERCSAARAYLAPARSRPNLTVVTGARATRVTLDARRVTGVAYRVGRQERHARAAREVVVSSGAVASPRLLLLSGIGPADELRRVGIEPRHDLPGVGRNFHDHIDFVFVFTSGSAVPMGISMRGTGQLLRGMSEWRRSRTGMLTTNFAEVGAFVRSGPGVDRADLQLHFVVGVVDDHNRRLHYGHGYSCHVCVLRPSSRGTIRVPGPDPMAAPLIDPNFLATDEDLDTLVAGFHLTRRLLAGAAFDPYRGRELYTAGVDTDQAVRDIIRSRADTVYHPAGSCRMGIDREAVVDPLLRVRGLDGLRVADASVMPRLVSGNTTATTIVIAERAAALMRGAA